MRTIATLGHESRRTSFSYEGSVATGVVLLQSSKPRIEAGFFKAALQAFAGKELKGGFKEDVEPYAQEARRFPGQEDFSDGPSGEDAVGSNRG